MTKVLLLVLAALVTGACADATIPTIPTAAPVAATPAPPPVPAADNLSITRFSVAGQITDGQFRYWPEVVIKNPGTRGLTVTQISFWLPGESRAAGEMRMTHVMKAGTVSVFNRNTGAPEFASTVEIGQVSLTVSFVDDTRRTGQVTVAADVPPFVAVDPSPSLRISAFTVTEFEGGFGIWPKLTLTESTGTDSVTITRLKFQLLGIGATPTFFGSWHVPAGGTLKLFHDLSYGEPEFIIGSSSKVDEVSVILSFVDRSGRASDVSAVATVSR